MNNVEIIFRQLSFSIKLENYVQKNHLDIELFDIDLSVIKDSQIVVLNSGKFTLETLMISSQININICFGTAALVLWKSIEDKGTFGGKKWPERLKSENYFIAGLIYSIRCCFAHNPGAPTWKLKPRQQTIYHIGNKRIDLRYINDEEFNYEAIGGYETLWDLKKLAENNNLIDN